MVPETTSYTTTFARHRDNHVLESWRTVNAALKQFGISYNINLMKGSMTVSTTREAPHILVKAWDLTILLSRSVPVHQAIKILDDDMSCDVIHIGNFIRNKKRFAERRNRLLGPNMSTLKGNTVVSMGSSNGRGLIQVRRISEDCMNNTKYPMDHIQQLKNEGELAKHLANENWGRILPKYEKDTIKQKKPSTKDKKPYTRYPPPKQHSKIDLEPESGEFSLGDKKKSSAKKQQKKADKRSKNKAEEK